MGIPAWGHWEAVTSGSITVTPAHGAMMSHLLSQGLINKKYVAALKHFPAFSELLYTPPAPPTTAPGPCDVCPGSWDVPASAAVCTDTSQSQPTLVHRGECKHDGYILPAPPGAPAFHQLGLRCCHFPKRYKLNHPWALCCIYCLSPWDTAREGVWQELPCSSWRGRFAL